jgi:FAD/FMN-containing dehydrogenase
VADSQHVESHQAVVSDLERQIRGPLIQPGDPEYDEARSVWNAIIDRRPALIVRCAGIDDVVTGVNAARTHGLSLSIKGGGHNIAGLAVCEGGLMLDMSALRGVQVDPARRVARAEPGCLLGDVDRETQAHGLAAVLGFVSATGCAGLTLGGGFGYLTRRFGWTTDNLAAIELVTADGRVVRASDSENSELFWGLCGGGGNFGVATSFEYKLHPVGPDVFAGAVAWRGEEAASVLELYRSVLTGAPRELACVASLRLAPPAPWIAKEVHGKPIVALFACYSGRLEGAERVLAPIKSFGSPVGDILQQRTYVSQQSLLDATQPKGRRYYWKSEYLRSFDPSLFTRAIEHASRIVSPHSAILFFPVDGATNELPEDHSAVGNRDAVGVLNIAAAWERATDDQRNIEWARTAWRDLRQFSTGGTYINFLTEEEGDDRTRAAYRTNYPRLAQLKAIWDPGNLFHANKNIGRASVA